jgi:transposase, IS5 family
VTSEYNEKIFSILENVISKGKQKTGRKGMDLWQIFVLSQVRLCIGASYERLTHLANYDHLVRQIMGVEKEHFFERTTFEYQNIYDNVTLLDDETVQRIYPLAGPSLARIPGLIQNKDNQVAIIGDR